MAVGPVRRCGARGSRVFRAQMADGRQEAAAEQEVHRYQVQDEREHEQKLEILAGKAPFGDGAHDDVAVQLALEEDR